MENDINKLLSLIQTMEIERRVRLIEKRERGDCYNVFDILGLSTDEERLHSAFIANLLNPRGNHGCKDRFLKKFLYCFKILHPQSTFTLNTGVAKVTVETSIGYLNEDATSGGRLDILVEDGNSAIVIENKIFACDQTNQMLRYCRYAKQHYGDNAQILYLTLDGHSPSDTSTRNSLKENEDYYSISYATDIVKWLDLCLHECTYTPRIRETVGQYIDIIKQLTNNDMDEEYTQNINEELTRHPEAAVAIFSSGLDKYLLYCFNHFAVPIFKEYEKNKGLVFVQENMQSNTYKGFYFRKPEWKHYAIWIYLDTPGQGFYCGVSNYNEVGEKKIPISNELSCLLNPNDGWPLGFSWLDEYRYWNAETTIDMINGKFAENILEIVDMILTDINECHIDIP